MAGGSPRGFDEAAALAEDALKRAEAALPASDLVLGKVKLALGEALAGGDSPADAPRAVRLVEDAVLIRSKPFGDQHWRIG